MAKYDIFISYRREGGYDTAKHLYDLLTRDGYKVSFDIDTLRNGDFDTSLLKRIDECKDFILIIDEHSFDRTLDPHFNPNNDWLRQELAYAIKKGKNIIPIFLNGVKGFPKNLPSDIKGVSKKNGPEYNRYYFNDFYTKLKSHFILSKSIKSLKRYISIFIILLVAFSITVYYTRNVKSDTNILNSNQITENEISWIVDLAKSQFNENHCIWWTSFSNNSFVTPLSHDRESVERDEDAHGSSDKYKLKGKLYINEMPFSTTATGLPSTSTIILYGCNAGADYIEISTDDHLNGSIDPETIGESLGFTRIGEVEHDEYGHFIVKYKRENLSLIVDVSYGSAGYFPTLILSELENE